MKSIFIFTLVSFFSYNLSGQISAESFFEYDIKYYNIDLKASSASNYIEGFVEISFITTNNSDSISFQLYDGFEIEQVEFNSKISDYSFQFDTITINVKDEILFDALNTIKIVYKGNAKRTNNKGYINTMYASSSVTYTTCEPYYTYCWLPCNQNLTDKIDSIDVALTTYKTNWGISNGLMTEKEIIDDEYVKYHWKSRYPIAYYLIFLNVGPYFEHQTYAILNDNDSILFQSFLLNVDNINEVYSTIELTKDIMNLFIDKFGDYPFANERYGYSLVPIGGAMENQTNTLIRHDLMTTDMTSTSGGFVPHELGHSWFGNNITCGNWQDIWINEGFAEFTENIAIEFLVSKSAAISHMNGAINYALYNPELPLYVPFEELTYSRIFDRISYDKGAAVLHMIRFMVNDDELFFEIMKEFTKRYTGKTAIGEDFKDLLHEMTAIDFNSFFEQWYYGFGYPTYNVVYYQNGKNLKLDIHQTTADGRTPFFEIPIELKLIGNDNDTIVRIEQNEPEQIYWIEIPFEVQTIEIDPNNWIINKVGSIEVSSKELMNVPKIQIYPNPGEDVINIEIPKYLQINDVKIFDLMGREIDQFLFKNNFLEVDYLVPGVYIVYFKTSKGEINKKLIIK